MILDVEKLKTEIIEKSEVQLQCQALSAMPAKVNVVVGRVV